MCSVNTVIRVIIAGWPLPWHCNHRIGGRVLTTPHTRTIHSLSLSLPPFLLYFSAPSPYLRLSPLISPSLMPIIFHMSYHFVSLHPTPVILFPLSWYMPCHFYLHLHAVAPHLHLNSCCISPPANLASQIVLFLLHDSWHIFLPPPVTASHLKCKGSPKPLTSTTLCRINGDWLCLQLEEITVIVTIRHFMLCAWLQEEWNHIVIRCCHTSVQLTISCID